MDKNEWYKAGEEIKNQVQNAIDTGDFSKLGITIGDTVNRAMGEVSHSLNQAVGEVSHGFERAIKNGTAAYQNRNSAANPYEAKTYRQDTGNRNPYSNTAYPQRPACQNNTRLNTKLFAKYPKGAVSGIVCSTMGYGAMAISGVSLVVTALAGGISIVGLSIAGGITAAGLGLGAYGSNLRNRTQRYRQYVDMVKDKLYCSIEDMASGTGRKEKFIRRDLKKMIRLGMFKQAHLDQKETCLIASDEMYEQYKLAQKSFEEEQKEIVEQAVDSEVAGVIEEGRNYVRLIRKCNDEIPGEEMSGKLDRLELLVTRIFAQVEKEPERAPELRKMLSYYLPTTQKLLEVYRDLDKQQIDVSNVAKTKIEIEGAVDTINEAFERFLDELFREKAWDVQSDISVLNTMLKQDGYLKEDFEDS